MKLLEKMKIDKVVAIFTCSCSFCMSAAMYTSFLVEREAGIPPSLPPSSNEARLEVEEAELGGGVVGYGYQNGNGETASEEDGRGGLDHADMVPTDERLRALTHRREDPNDSWTWVTDTHLHPCVIITIQTVDCVLVKRRDLHRSPDGEERRRAETRGVGETVESWRRYHIIMSYCDRVTNKISLNDV
jgi:hypothetical protein